jgi:hypothetical protein
MSYAKTQIVFIILIIITIIDNIIITIIIIVIIIKWIVYNKINIQYTKK